MRDISGLRQRSISKVDNCAQRKYLGKVENTERRLKASIKGSV
jgi:hypothetical protein